MAEPSLDDLKAALAAARAENVALRETNDRLSTVFDTQDAGYAIMEILYAADGAVCDILGVEFNSAYAVKTGIAPWPGRRLSEVFQMEDYWWDLYASVARTGAPQRLENYSADLDRWFSVHVSRVGGEGAHLVAAVFDDTTERKKAEAALRESEEKYRLLFERLDEGFCVIELMYKNGRPTDYRLIEVNPAFEQQSGLSNVSGKLRTEVAPLGDEEQWLETYDEVARTGIGQRFERYHEPTDRWYSVYVTIAAKDLSSPRLTIVFTDTTLRKQAETALRESEEQYRSLYTKMEQGYIEVELIRGPGGDAIDYRYVVLNPAYERLTGIPIDKALGRPSLEVIPDLSSFWAETFQRIVDNHTAEEFEYEEKALDRWFGIYAYPGDGDRLTVLALDITQRKKAEAALRASEARFQQFANASAVGLWIRGADNLDMEYASPAIATIYGVAADALLGDVKIWAGLILPEDRDIALEHIAKARQGEAVVHEFRIQRPDDGTFRWIRNTDFPLFDAEGRVERIGGLAEDVTEARLQAEHQGILLAELQHRVRNIMAIIRAIARRSGERAGSVAEYGEVLTGRLLALSRVQALLTRAANANVGLRTIVTDEVSVQAHHEGQYDVDGPDIQISPKAAEVLTLALHELATNALKYGALSAPGGKVTVRWTVGERDGGPWLALDWTEEGAPEPQDPTADKPRRQGFGSELIEGRIPYELRGRSSLVIAPGGAQCHLEFPLKAGASVLETGAPKRATVFGGALDMTGEADLNGRRVLVVEDDYYLATDAARALRGAGAEVLGPCSTEEDAREELADQRPDAVLLDINLGSGPTFKLAKALKDRGIPFVFVTGYDQDVIPAEFDGIGRLEKPVQLRRMVGAVAELLPSAAQP